MKKCWFGVPTVGLLFVLGWIATTPPPQAEAASPTSEGTSLLPEQTLRTTPEHPFWVRGRGWVAARDLAPGDHLRGADGATQVVLTNRLREQKAQTYNFEVEDFHTYFVSGDRDATPVWVHNTCRPTWARPGWGERRFVKELHRQGFRFVGPTRGRGGRIYQNATGAQIRIMPRPKRAPHRGESPAKLAGPYYYRYREAGGAWGAHQGLPGS